MNLPVIVLLFVFLLITFRQLFRVRIAIWQIMTVGAMIVLVTGQTGIHYAWRAIDKEVMIFLFGMFYTGKAFEESGELTRLASIFFRKVRTPSAVLFYILFGSGILSSFLMNDTVAIVGTPLVLSLATAYRISATPLLLALAFGVTIGSVPSPIGNPQNFLIAVGANMENPFFAFLSVLAIPSFLNLLVAFFLIRFFHPKQFQNGCISTYNEEVREVDYRTAIMVRSSLFLIIVFIFLRIFSASFGLSLNLPLALIAPIAMLPIFLGSSKRFSLLRSIDWHTLLFFASMFVLMDSVWRTGVFQNIFKMMDINIHSVPSVFIVSILLSQLISNVPMVALYLPLMEKNGFVLNEILALAAGSTIAGNLFLLGAASNVIIAQNAEKRGEFGMDFFSFARVGVPLTALNALIYYIFL